VRASALALLGALAVLGGCSSRASSSTTVPVSSPSVLVISPVVGQTPTSGITASVLTASLAADGSAAQPSSNFAASVSKIYAVLTLDALPAGTKLSYVRYIDGHFVDSKSEVTGPNAKYFYFEFAAKDAKGLHAGHYRLRFYVNERAVREISYAVGT
jgi:hypothetical protein